MNTRLRALLALLTVVLTVALLTAAPASADDRVVCESRKDKREFCSVYRAYEADIRLSRQFSDSSCIEGISWGRNDRGIWVDDGCRAEFSIRRGYRGGDDRRGYDDYRDDDYYRREQERREQERREYELEQERRRNEELRRQIEREKESSYRREQCPQGFEPGNHRCSDAERRKGCKDMKMPGGTTCNSRGWGSR